jgi:acyl-CoA reductase-like NAD-dependent aldehyde dehydrogenase
LSKGAVDVTPSNSTFQNPPPVGNYLAPRILVDVTHDMLVMQEETFGPLIPVAKVASDEEAIALMNDSTYGLTASVWTKDLARGQEIMEELEAGTVFINRCDYPNPVSEVRLGQHMEDLKLTKAIHRTLLGPDGRTPVSVAPLGQRLSMPFTS